MINIKSEYNFLDSYAKLDDIITYALEKQMPYIGICDFSNTYANYKFYTKCVENNIKPVIGLELKYKNQTYLFYAKNHQGVVRLNELNTRYLNDGVLELNNKEENLILILGHGVITEKLINGDFEVYEKLESIFKNDLYVGFDQNIDHVNYAILSSTNIRVINISEIRFLYKKDIEIYMTLKAIKDNSKFKVINKNKSQYETLCPDYYYLHDQVQFNDILNEFISKIDIMYPVSELKPPKYNYVYDDLSSSEFLYQLATVGLSKRRDNKVSNVDTERLNYELNVINEMGFADYFLIVWDIVKYAKNNNIYVGPGRGSASGSLVSYCLGITEIDPIQHNLIFERFLNPERISMPDIDIDFEDTKRNDIVEYIIERFGHEHVCKIGTISKFLAKSTFKDVAKVWDIDVRRVESISKKLNSRLSFFDNLKENKAIRSEMIGNLELERIINIIQAIEGMPRQTSIHAAGIIIGHEKITNYCSVDFENVSLAEAKDLEELGLLKVDILALSNLSFIHEIVDKVRLTGVEIDINKIPLDDELSFKLLSEAKSLGIFQMESEGMKKTLQIVKPNSFKDIANVLALYRPGPKEFIAEYVQNRNVFKFKGAIKEILEDTHGIIVFQEQIILIATNMAGYNLGQADLLRRAIAKKDQIKIDQIGVDFVKRSINRGVDPQEAQMTFDLIAKFANYGFNKAHAYAYAMVVYQMSYLKVHFPQIFYAELFYFNFKTPKKMDFLSELERQKIHLINPDIIQSDLKVSIEGTNLRIGFLVIDSIGIEVAEGLINARQYIKDPTSLIEVVFEVLHKINISSNQVNKLIDAGCFDRYGYNRATQKSFILNLLETDAYSLYKMGGEIEIEIEDEFTFEKNCLYEKNALSINIKYDQFREVLKEKQKHFNHKIYTIDQLFYLQVNPMNQIYVDHIVLVKLMGIKEIRTKKGVLMCFLTVVSTQTYDITVFSREYAAYSKSLNNSVGHYLICQVNLKEDKIFLKKI